MWRFLRRLSLTPYPQTLYFGGHKVKLDADGQVISEVSDELLKVFTDSPAWAYTPAASEPEETTTVVVADDSLEAGGCDIMEPETKSAPAPKKTSTRSRRKTTKSKAKD